MTTVHLTENDTCGPLSRMEGKACLPKQLWVGFGFTKPIFHPAKGFAAHMPCNTAARAVPGSPNMRSVIMVSSGPFRISVSGSATANPPVRHCAAPVRCMPISTKKTTQTRAARSENSTKWGGRKRVAMAAVPALPRPAQRTRHHHQIPPQAAVIWCPTSAGATVHPIAAVARPAAKNRITYTSQSVGGLHD